MTEALIIGVFALGALIFVTAPLREPESHSVTDPRTELEEKKIMALTAIVDLEGERDVGKLSAEDFAELRQVYEVEALDALHKLDAISAQDGNDPLEREIARVRERLSGNPCTNCGAPRRKGTEVCLRCGA